jgi:hypothetical protein
MKWSPDWGCHIPVLIEVFKMSGGEVLELGVGMNSTPLLHWLCFSANRQLTSYENSPKYLQRFHKYGAKNHHTLVNLENWEDFEVNNRCGMAFIDQEPAAYRAETARKLANSADYVVLHDSEPRNANVYKYGLIYPLYKYRFDYTKYYRHTTVLSNFHDLKELNDRL